MEFDGFAIVAFNPADFKCFECGEQFQFPSAEEDKPVMVVADCPIHHCEEELIFHARCIPAEILVQLEENRRREMARWN